jgi:hypothetical protein
VPTAGYLLLVAEDTLERAGELWEKERYDVVRIFHISIYGSKITGIDMIT